ncbi:MAG: AbrB/MazE/SpoVT family DNA-binding domain-containing protein [Chloroflexi bacterium]|jgi:AbrB family looped-hinge helix DNA binding protein|nr:AbrB/MazE/SpoVT family DNA-binding domain-containing protein [Chloroflexota bacterium]
MRTLTISSKGWIVIPAELRKKYGLHPGERVALVDYGGVLAIVPYPANPIHEARGRLKGDRSLVEALLRERTQERARES